MHLDSGEVGSIPTINTKHEMLGFDSRRAARPEDPTLKMVGQHLTYYVLVAQLVEH